MTLSSIGPVHFLLVDDLEENLLSLEALLRRDNLVILKAKSGTEALEILLHHDVGLAFLDVQMPGMDGFELAELMRSTERTRRVPIIFLTAGTIDWQRRFRGYEAGAVDFLHKPIEPDILKSKAEVFFEINWQQKQLAYQRDQIKATAEENAHLLEESRKYGAMLKEMDRRKDEFLATLAHELRNPLAPICNGVHILKTSPKEEVAAQIRDMMDRQLTHLIRLIDDLLDVSRISNGKIGLQKSQITVSSVLTAAIEATQPLISTHKLSLTTKYPEKDLWMNADFTRLSQVVSNLLNNAVKYTPAGGSIVLSAYQSGHDVVICVADTGCGISRDMQEKIFELFIQVDNSLDKSQGGLGIGLALAKQLVEMHGGQISVESPGIGKGSTFSVKFPLIEPHFEKDALQDNQHDVSPQQLRALVVDDNVSSAKTLGWMMEFAGHTALLAHDGPKALEIAKSEKPDVILLDIGMPGMNGYEVCRELRKDPSLKDVILIAQTGWGQERDRALAMESGFDYHLVKPVKYEKFCELMTKIQNDLATA